MHNIIDLVDERIKTEEDLRGLNILNGIAAHPEVQKPAVALPDFHAKKMMEAPSSIAVATTQKVVPHFTSCSLNCGMGLLNTRLNRKDFSDKRLTEFFNLFRATKQQDKYNLDQEQLKKVVQQGAQFILDKHNLPEHWGKAVENEGSLRQPLISDSDLNSIMDPDDLQNADYAGLKNIGLGFGGNHFIEIQEVTEVLDNESCTLHRLSKGDVVIMYHGGGGIVPGFVGGYFGNREKGYKRDIKFLYNKLKFHMRGIQGAKVARDRWNYYFNSQKYVAISVESVEGARLNMAHAASMNYGYAYRMVAVARMVASLKQMFADPLDAANLLHDSSHNHILNEKIDGVSYWVHRHNSCRVGRGSLNILPGFHTTSSYIGVGLERTGAYLNTMPHGAGHTIKEYALAGLSQPCPDRKTKKFVNESENAVEVEHVTDEGVDSVIEILKRKVIFTPIAKVTPFAVLKGYHN